MCKGHSITRRFALVIIALIRCELWARVYLAHAGKTCEACALLLDESGIDDFVEEGGGPMYRTPRKNYTSNLKLYNVTNLTLELRMFFV